MVRYRASARIHMLQAPTLNMKTVMRSLHSQCCNNNIGIIKLRSEGIVTCAGDSGVCSTNIGITKLRSEGMVSCTGESGVCRFRVQI